MAHHYHAGELAVQERAGVRQMASRIENSIRDSVPPVASAFLEQRRWVVLATADRDDRPWASVLSGPSGFARMLDPETLRIDAAPLSDDPLAEHLDTSRFVGLVAPDLASRRRLRLNGRLDRSTDGALLIRVDQVYSNCPKYIQRRTGEENVIERRQQVASRARSLTGEQRSWIRQADTFFIATLNPQAGADASHRGGMPGFVTVEGNRLMWPDYAGNSMFNTLGNIAIHPWAGLVFPDFKTGRILQLTGRATIDWDPVRTAQEPGAHRLVEVEVDEVVEIAGGLPLSLQLVDYSSFNPGR
jgi:uncharacterized protein